MKETPSLLAPSYVETQIDLGKAPKAGPSYAANPRIEEVERNEAQVGTPVEEVELRPRRTPILEPFGRNLVGEETQMPPLRSEERMRHIRRLGSVRFHEQGRRHWHWHPVKRLRRSGAYAGTEGTWTTAQHRFYWRWH